MKPPITTRNTAKPRLSWACGTRWLRALPTNEPTIPIAAKIPISDQSKAGRAACDPERCTLSAIANTNTSDSAAPHPVA